MIDPKLTVAAYRYEHTNALFDGDVDIRGFDTSWETAPLVSDIFRRMIAGDFDVAELGLTYFLRMWDTPGSPFLALPIFPNRNFRHSAVFVNSAAGIERPEDLAGKTIGEFALYDHDAGVWPKGILAEEYGVTPDLSRWVIGGTDHPIPSFDWIPQPVPPNVEVRHAADGQTLGAMLETGEIDALFSVDVPAAVLAGSSSVKRLFNDYERVERDYYRRTSIFPIMHVIAIRKTYLAAHPEVARAVYDAFLEAKDRKAHEYRDQVSKQHMRLMTPWFSELFAENQRLLPEDWWPYGVEKNRKAVDTFLRYHHEQGMSQHLLTCDDIFVPDLLTT